MPPTEVIPTDMVEVGFKDIDAAILVGSMPRKEGMERKDLLKANVAIFKTQGAALDKYAKKTVKVTFALQDLLCLKVNGIPVGIFRFLSDVCHVAYGYNVSSFPLIFRGKIKVLLGQRASCKPAVRLLLACCFASC